MQDPTDPQTFNRYAYARNNPIRFVDPTGNFIIELITAIVVGAIVGAAIGATLSALDALVTGRPVGQAALSGAIGGAIGGAVGGAVFGTATAFLGEAAAPVLAVAGLGLSTYAAVENFKNQNYFSGGFSAIMAFSSAHELYSLSQSSTSSGQSSSSQGSSSKSSELDVSPESSVSGSGNADVELKSRDLVRQTIKSGAEEPTFGGLLGKGKNWLVDVSYSKSQGTAVFDILTGVPSLVRAYANPAVGFWGRTAATAEFGFGLFGGRLVVAASRYYKFVKGAKAAGNFSRWSRNLNMGNKIERYGGYAVKGDAARGVYDAEKYALT